MCIQKIFLMYTKNEYKICTSVWQNVDIKVYIFS